MRTLVPLSLAILLMPACSSGVDGELVVGVQADPIAGLQSVRVTATTAAGTQVDVVDASRLPWERVFRAHAPSPQIAVKVEGLDPSGNAVITRTARAPMPPAMDSKLLRIRLQSVCAKGAAPACTAANQTCISGRCQDDELLAGDLERYRADWATDVPDICRPLNAGPPEVIVGTGQTDYLPLMSGQVVQAERGPQGGHHLYIALRQKNLHRSGSTTTITGKQPASGVEIPPTSFVFSFDPDEGGYCKLYGLRYQLDNGGLDYTQFLDKDLDITVTVRDSSANVGTGTVRVHVAPTVLGM
jgi:hypothetical protein